MNKSLWGAFVIMMGITALVLIVLFQTITNTDQHNSQVLQEVTEAAMWDAYDYANYRQTGNVRITQEKFVENFIRRFAASANSSRNYTIEFLDVNEFPPKVSIRVKSKVTNSPLRLLAGSSANTTFNFELNNYIDAILETPY